MPGGWGIRPFKKFPRGWSGLELTDTLHTDNEKNWHHVKNPDVNSVNNSKSKNKLALNESRRHWPERASELDFKYAAAPRFGHSDVFFALFCNEHPKVPPVNHQQICLINGICGT